MRRSVCTPWTAPGTCATPSTPTPRCAGWSPITPTPIVEAGERGLADVLGLEFEPAPHVLSTSADLL